MFPTENAMIHFGDEKKCLVLLMAPRSLVNGKATVVRTRAKRALIGRFLLLARRALFIDLKSIPFTPMHFI